MKLFLLSSLLALAFGSNDVAVTERNLLDNKWHMNAVSVSGNVASGFTIAYTHEVSGASAGSAFVNSGSCLNENGFNGGGATGVTLGSPSISGATSTVTVAVTGANAPSTSGTPTSSFCVWYGVGDGTNYYGYREVLFTINWVFNGAWTAIGFTTQAYDPVSGGDTVQVSATASNCGSGNYMVGEAICTEACSTNSLFKVSDITSLTVTATGLGPYSPTQYSETVNGNCRRATYLLPIEWFPLLVSEGSFSVTVDGSVTYANARRMLQEQEEAPAATGPIIGTQTYTVTPAEESSASSVVAGAAAAAAAVGAALLI